MRLGRRAKSCGAKAHALRMGCEMRRNGGSAARFGGSDLHHAALGIDADQVAVLDKSDGTAIERFGHDMNSGRDFSRGTRHAPIGEQRHALAAILQEAEKRTELVKLGHAIGPGTLISDDGNEIAGEPAGLEGGLELRLIAETHGRSFDNGAIGGHAGCLDDRPAEIAF
jgi:hypothetical protein